MHTTGLWGHVVRCAGQKRAWHTHKLHRECAAGCLEALQQAGEACCEVCMPREGLVRTRAAKIACGRFPKDATIGWWGMLREVEAKRRPDTHMSCIEMHVVGWLEMQWQGDRMHGRFKRMSRLTQSTKMSRFDAEHKRDVLRLGQAQGRHVAPQTKDLKG